MKRFLLLLVWSLSACENPPQREITFDERFGPCYTHCVQGGVRDPHQIHYRCVKMCRTCLRDHPVIQDQDTCPNGN